MLRTDFIAKVASECVTNNVSIKIIQKPSINNYAGYFDCQKKELVCAYKNSIGFEVLIHEYNHFLQWKNRPDFWKQCDGDNGSFLNWLDGIDLSKNKISSNFKKTVELERDCEINSLKCIEEFNLDVDIELYTKKANSYLFSYIFAKKNRKWPQCNIYDASIIDVMPCTILPLENYLNGKDHNNKKMIKLYC